MKSNDFKALLAIILIVVFAFYFNNKCLDIYYCYNKKRLSFIGQKVQYQRATQYYTFDKCFIKNMSWEKYQSLLKNLSSIKDLKHARTKTSD